MWWVETSDGLKILKKISNSERTLKCILAAVDHLSRNGVLLPKVNKTIDGEDYVIMDGTCFVLSDAVKGKTPSYDSPRELKLIVEAMAGFHKASAGFTPPEDSKPKYHLGTWIEEYSQQLDTLEELYKKELQSRNPNPIGKTLIKEFPYFHELARAAIERLKGEEYSNWVEKMKKRGSLVHQDFAAGNLVLTKRGIYVLDTDSIAFDLPARDIRKLLSKIIKRFGKWDAGYVKDILNYYNAENPLSHSEWEVVKLDLMFPHLFLGATNKYYSQKEKDWTPEKYHQRIKEMIGFEKTIGPILSNFHKFID